VRCITSAKAAARAGAIRYSSVTITGPSSGPMCCAGSGAAPRSGAGVKSVSAPPSTDSRRVAAHPATPKTAAAITAPRTSIMAATCPHSNEPAAAPPISAIW